MALEKLYTVDEVANYFNVQKKTVYLWTSKGLLVSEKIGKKIYVRESEIESFIERRKK